jgi:hypothetical protein
VIGGTVEGVCSPCEGGLPSPSFDRTPCGAIGVGSCFDEFCAPVRTEDRCSFGTGECRRINCCQASPDSLLGGLGETSEEPQMCEVPHRF